MPTVRPFVLDGYAEVADPAKQQRALDEFKALGGDTAALSRDLVWNDRDAARLRREREAFWEHRRATWHERELHDLLASLRRLRADPKALEALSIDSASVEAQEAQITSVLHRVTSEAARSDPRTLAQRRRSAAKSTPRARLHHQIPAFTALGVAGADKQVRKEIKQSGFTVTELTAQLKTNEDAFKEWAQSHGLSEKTLEFLKNEKDRPDFWRALGFEPLPEGSKVRSVVYEDAHLRAIRRYFVPEVIRTVYAHVRKLERVIQQREAQELAGRWSRYERRKELTRRVSATLNRLTADLVHVFYPLWARGVKPRRVRVTIENLAKRRRTAAS